MFVESNDDEQIIERVAALDVGKAVVVFVPPVDIRQLRDLTRVSGRSGRGPDRGEGPGREAARRHLHVAPFAEIGLDMTRIPTASHLPSWAKFAPG
jgi:hypothetical protein